MVSTTVVELGGALVDERFDRDRATCLRLGRLFVLAVGVVLVVATAVTLYELVTGLVGDVLTAQAATAPPPGG